MLTLLTNFVILATRKRKGANRMSFYDTLGFSQVKCFSYPDLIITDETIDLVRHCGAFAFFSKGDMVPHRTLFYDFGENFMVFDYRKNFWGKKFEGYVHIIENGRYVGSQHYLKLKNNHPIHLVVDNNGMPLNIKDKKDFEKIVEDDVKTSKKYEDARAKYLIQMGGFPLTGITTSSELRALQKEKGWTDEFLMLQFEKNDAARELAYEDAIEPFLLKWCDYKTQMNMYGGMPIGILYDLFRKNPTKYEWEKIIEKFEEAAIQEETTLKKQIEHYLAWAKQHLVKIEDDFYTLFPSAKGEVQNV